MMARVFWAQTWRRTLAGTAAGALMILAYVVLPAISTAPLRRLNWRVLISINVYNYSTFLGVRWERSPVREGLHSHVSKYGPIRGTLLLALLWTGWHLPLFI